MLINYEDFKQKILKLTGIDLSCYKERQMRRRIDSLIKRNNYDDYNEYFKVLTQDAKLYKEFINYLTINVSEFYRNPAQWEVLEQDIIPNLLKEKKNLKIWSAACSTGEEPYSLVMAMSKFMELSSIKILATDIDDGAVAKAKRGIYVPKSLDSLPKGAATKYFDKEEENYKIKNVVQNCVEFRKHNLLKDKYIENCDLIVCRNVMIYFTEEAKSVIYNSFREALSPNGVLFVGSTEQIISPQNYKMESIKTFFYRRSES